MRVVVSFVDRYIVVNGEARTVDLDTAHDVGLRGISWDGEIGHRWYDALSQRDSEFFHDEIDIEPFLALWESAPLPEPPPLPPHEDGEPLPLPRNAIPATEPPEGPIPPPEGDVLPWDAPAPEDLVPLDPSLRIGYRPGEEPEEKQPQEA